MMATGHVAAHSCRLDGRAARVPFTVRRYLLASVLVICSGCVADREASTTTGEAIEEQIADAVAAGSRQVRIVPGVYRIHPVLPSEAHLTLRNLRDLDIDARGVTLLCVNPCTAVDIRYCQNLTLSGLTIDYDPLTITQGTIIGFAPDRTWTDVRIHAGYPAPIPYDQAKRRVKQGFLWTYDPVTRLLKPGAANRFVETIRPLSNGVYRLEHGASQYRDQAAVGDFIRIPQRCERATGVILVGCKNLMVADLTLHAAPAHFGIEARFCHGLTLQKVRVTPGPAPAGATEPRLSATVGDGFHLCGITGRLLVDQCELNGTGDDGIALYAEDGLVLKTAEGNKQSVAFNWLGLPPPAPGTRLRFMTGKPERYEVATVVACARTSLTRAEIENVRSRAIQKPYPYLFSGAAFDIELDRKVNVQEGDWVLREDEFDEEYVVRNNRITNCGSRGIVANRSNGRIEGNAISNTYLSGIQTFAAFRSEGFSGPQARVGIFKNRLSETGIGRSTADLFQGAICVMNWEGASRGFGGHNDGGGHRDIRIEGNHITRAWGANIQVQDAEGVSIRNNRFTGAHQVKVPVSASRMLDYGALISLQDVRNVTVADNSIVAAGPYLNREPLLSKGVSGLKAAAPFTR